MRLHAMALLLLGCTGTSIPCDAGCASGLASAEQHCTNMETRTCTRELNGGRLTMAQRDACLAAVPQQCERAMWPEGCAPINRDADACIDLLSDGARVSIPTPDLLEMFDDCDLCP